jgi:hypothetical protein
MPAHAGAHHSRQGRCPKTLGERTRGEQGTGNLHNAMRILLTPSACERLAARPERCAGLRCNAQQRLQRCETGAFATAIWPP